MSRDNHRGRLSQNPGQPSVGGASRSSSTSQSGGVFSTTHTPAQHEESESTVPLSHSPSLNPSAQASGQSTQYQSRQFRRPSYPLAPGQFLGRPIVAEPQSVDNLGYGFLPGAPGGPYWSSQLGPPQVLQPGLGTYFEPQGELQAQLQSQRPPQQDFVHPTPLPVRPETLARVNSAPFAGGNPANPGMIATARAGSSADITGRGQVPPNIMTRAGQKRKADSRSDERRESVATVASPISPATTDPRRPSAPKPSQTRAAEAMPRVTRSHRQEPHAEPEDDDEEAEEEEMEDPPQAQAAPNPQPPKIKQTNPAEIRRVAEIAPHLTTVLPAGKVFPIQIGSDLFRLSGASISSDAPSYFSHYFGEQLIQTGGRASQVKTLYIDRDPETFKDIALHLQGYYVKPRDEEHFVRLFADAQFYSLPRLTSQLFKSEIFIQVGDRHFQIPRDIFSSPGDSPNFFSLGFAHFFSTPSEVFPGLDRQTLLRPPSILPPAVANRSGDVFADLLRILQGYEVKIRDETHRAELLRDARYFHLKGVEQKLLPCKITHNLLRNRSEIVLRLEDIRQSGVSFLSEARSGSGGAQSAAGSTGESSSRSDSDSTPLVGWITYQRPFVDETAHDLILEISSSEATKLDLASMRAAFSGQVKARVASLFSVIANKLNLPAMVPLGLMMMQSGGGIAAQQASPANSGVSGDKVRIRIDRDAFVSLDGDVVEWEDNDDDDSDEENSDENMTDSSVRVALPNVRKWKRERALNKEMEWLIQRGQWRLHVEAAEEPDGNPSRVEVVLCAIRLEGYTREMHRNRTRDFLA